MKMIVDTQWFSRAILAVSGGVKPSAYKAVRPEQFEGGFYLALGPGRQFRACSVYADGYVTAEAKGAAREGAFDAQEAGAILVPWIVRKIVEGEVGQTPTLTIEGDGEKFTIRGKDSTYAVHGWPVSLVKDAAPIAPVVGVPVPMATVPTPAPVKPVMAFVPVVPVANKGANKPRVRLTPAKGPHVPPVAPAASTPAPAPKATPAPVVSGEWRIEDRETKKGRPFCLAVPPARVSKDEWRATLARVKEAGGWFTIGFGGKPGGWSFWTREECESFVQYAEVAC